MQVCHILEFLDFCPQHWNHANLENIRTSSTIQGRGPGGLAPAPAGKGPIFWAKTLIFYENKIVILVIKSANFGPKSDP